ncbi:MAG: transcriptional regulator [Alcaligenaceae bacterium]|nr:MAG: transcriptional regulator [Alcaligenaceae bacterium]
MTMHDPIQSHRYPLHTPPPLGTIDPELNRLVREIIGRVADKWTMLALEALAEHGRLRFTRVGELVGGISQKMLTKTLRQMEADGLVVRTVFAVVPPRVEYELTERGQSLGAAFCGVWLWAEEHRQGIRDSRVAFETSDAEMRGREER